MNRRQFLILVLAVLVLGAAGLVVYKQTQNSWHGGGAALGQSLLPNLPVNDIAQITIKAGTSEVTLARRDNLWRVHERADYPANFQQIREMLVKFGDLKMVQTVDIGPSQLGRLQLLPAGAGADTGTAVEFKDQNGKLVASVLLGKKHTKKPGANPQFGGMGDEGWPDGRYVLTGADAKTVAVISDPLDTVEAKPEQWLNKDFLTIEKPGSIAVEFPVATNSWTLTRASETNDWELAKAKAGEKLDESKISSVTSPFSSPNFNDVAARSASNESSNTVVTVHTFDGFTYTANIGTKGDDNYPVSFLIAANLPASRMPGQDEKPADKAKLDKDFQAQQKTLTDKLAKESAFTNWVYLLPAYSIDELLKTRGQLLEEAGTNAVSSTNSTAQAEK